MAKNSMATALAILVLAAGMGGIATADTNSSHTLFEPALEALLAAEKDVSELMQLNLSVYYVSDTLLEAKRAFVGENITFVSQLLSGAESVEVKQYLQSLFDVAASTPQDERRQQDYQEAIRLAQIIAARKQQAYRIIDTLSLAEKREKDLESKGADMSAARGLLGKAKESFAQERFDEAQAQLVSAEQELDRALSEKERQAAISALRQGFLARNWRQLLAVLVVLAVASILPARQARKLLLRKKLKRMNLELAAVRKLLMEAQGEYFKTGRITRETYRLKEKRYKNRIIELQKNIKVAEISLGKKAENSSRKAAVLRVDE
ncbi:hypothetical protein J4475_01780 [Candidatus Woesearchaeota archaeon]|nr:hypothetical protein [Candidatus Woesearchaeota archaeon]